jgi:hypothetical protein
MKLRLILIGLAVLMGAIAIAFAIEKDYKTALIYAGWAIFFWAAEDFIKFWKGEK